MVEVDLQTKIQKLELDTIKAVTELQKDVQSLTREVTNLAQQIQRMSENYVTIAQHSEDIADLKSDLKVAKKVGTSRAILVGVLTSLITAVLVYEVTTLIK